MNNMEIEILNKYSDSMYKTLMTLKYFEIKNNKVEFEKNITKLRKILKEETNLYEEVITNGIDKKLLHSEINLVNCIKSIILNDYETMKNKRISNLFYKILNDKDTMIDNVLVDDSIKFIIYILKDYQKYDYDLYYDMKYALAYIYPNILKYLLETKFNVSKEVYWYSYFLKDIYKINDNDYFSRKLLFINDELMIDDLYSIMKIDDIKGKKGKMLCDIINRLMALLVYEKYEGLNPGEYLKLLKAYDESFTLKDAERILNFYNNDKQIPKMVRIIKGR